jgi:hypothetical protein
VPHASAGWAGPAFADALPFGGPGAQGAEDAERLMRQMADVTARMGAQHSLFIRILTARLTETRTLRGLWAGSARPERAHAETLRWLQRHCHESVAVDILHALAGCNGRMKLSDDEGASATAQLVGGIPTWRWPSAASVEWSEHVCAVLEGLLYTCYEDYIVVALHTVGHMLEAVAPLFDVAASCTDLDLTPPLARPRTPAGMDPGGAGGGRAGSDRERAHAAATQAVQFVRNAFPLLPALASVASYGGRVEKLSHVRASHLQRLQASVEHLLLTSTHVSALGEEADGGLAPHDVRYSSGVHNDESGDGGDGTDEGDDGGFTADSDAPPGGGHAAGDASGDDSGDAKGDD